MKNCPSCGNELADNAVMCVKCGNKISGEALSGSTVSDFGFMNKVKIGIILIAACKVLSWLSGAIYYLPISRNSDIFAIMQNVDTVIYNLCDAGIIAGIILALLAVVQFEKESPKK